MEINKDNYKICFYVPESHLQTVKQAMFAKGAGCIGHYDSCCWQTKGSGQFRPLQASQPFLGKQGQIESVDEYKVEMACDGKVLQAVIEALKSTHPYEEPAYDVWELLT